MTDETYKATVRLSVVRPNDECQSVLCSRIDGRCVGSHCGRCGQPSCHQGHYTSICRSSKATGVDDFHFCCPGNCELDAERAENADV